MTLVFKDCQQIKYYLMTNLNISLLLFDTLFLPIMLIRLIIIYFFGSKYMIPNMEFLDVMMHANNPYFNQESTTTIDVLNEDIRATIKRETKLFTESNNLIEQSINLDHENIINVVKKTDHIINELEYNDNLENNEIEIENNTNIEETLDTNTEESIHTETNFNLDAHIDKLFNDLENSVTTHQ